MPSPLGALEEVLNEMESTELSPPVPAIAE
jgi:hypothetical protein